MLVKESKLKKFVSWFLKSPARVIVCSFLLVIAIGTFLLSLPISHQEGVYFSVFDALFTTVSATCVTGLIVADTGTSLSVFGKVVLICLIQVGGLGLVTITSFFYNIFRRKIELRAKRLAQESSSSFSLSELPNLLKTFVGVTFVFEFTGGVILSTQYVPLFGWAPGIGRAFFQSISAFCNAGFDVLGDTQFGPFCSLTGFNNNPVVLITTGMLIVFGGLGFIVWGDIINFFTKKSEFRTHSKIMIKLTVLLILIGTISFLVFEWSNTSDGSIGTMSLPEKLVTAFFESVSLRTAGFSSVNLSNLTDTSKAMSCILMFIGTGSGSTGGGIKITTMAVLVFSVFSELRGNSQTVIEKSIVTKALVTKALAIFFSGLTIVAVLAFILSITERAALDSGQISFLDLIYEATSAFGTVGDSSANTPTLSSLGQLFIIPAMFFGRIGPITLALSLAIKEQKNVSVVYPEARIHIG